MADFASSGSVGVAELELALVLAQHDFEDELAVRRFDGVRRACRPRTAALSAVLAACCA